LNQKITKLSKDEAACGHFRNEEIGEAIASDSTRRILFVKDLPMEDSKFQDQETTLSSLRVQQHGTSRSSPGFKRLRRRRTDDEQSDIEEREENGWREYGSYEVWEVCRPDSTVLQWDDSILERESRWLQAGRDRSGMIVLAVAGDR
jgi:hypothetical protein